MTDAEARRAFRKWVRRFRLDDWTIRLVVKPGDVLEDGDNAVGRCAADARYLTATIEIARGCTEPDTVILHELLHVVLWPLQQAAQRALNRLGDEARSLAEEDVQERLEQTLIILARVLNLGFENEKPEQVKSKAGKGGTPEVPGRNLWVPTGAGAPRKGKAQ